MGGLPKGWVNVSIDDITSDVSYGVTAKSNPVEGDLQLLRITDIQDNKVDWSTVPYCAYETKYESSRLKNDDIVVARTGATVGKSFLIEDAVENSVYASYLIRLRLTKGTLPKYLASFLRTPSYWQQISEQKAGIGQPNVNGTKLKTLQLPLAPLPEQKRIVEKLDEALAQVGTIKARLDSIPNLLKRFRQSVLASAVSGKLTEEWRELNKPSFTNEEFRDAITEYRYQAWLNEKQKKYEEKGKLPKSDAWKNKYVAPTFDGEHLETLPNGWIQDVLEGLVYISARIGWKGLKASEYTNEGPLFLSVHGLNHGTYVELSEAFHISEERYLESPEIMLKNDDILLCKDGAGIGKIAIVKGLDEKASINSSLLLIRAGDFFDTKFLYYLLSGPKMQSLVHDRMTGSAVPHLFQRDVKEFILDVPPLIEQKEIVRLVDQYFAFAETIEAQVKKAQAKVDNLTQSILAKAFRGELVLQDPSDEPADKLLERIAKAREEAEALAKAAKKAEAAKKRAAKV